MDKNERFYSSLWIVISMAIILTGMFAPFAQTGYIGTVIAVIGLLMLFISIFYAIYCKCKCASDYPLRETSFLQYVLPKIAELLLYTGSISLLAGGIAVLYDGNEVLGGTMSIIGFSLFGILLNIFHIQKIKKMDKAKGTQEKGLVSSAIIRAAFLISLAILTAVLILTK